METVRQSRSGINYLIRIIKEKAQTITRAIFWKIPRELEDDSVCLKIGRYERKLFNFETLESNNPKSELTLDNEEFTNLIKFISENYEPFKGGVRQYIPLEDGVPVENIEYVRAIFNNPDKKEILKFITDNEILPKDLISNIEFQKKIKAIEEFETMLGLDLVEYEWQGWFKINPWVLGSDFVEIINERDIDTENIADYLMKAYDGFLDIIEIKRPEGKLKFWNDSLDHGNYIPSNELMKAFTQSSKYIYEIEREANSVKFLEKSGNIKTIKPRCVLIFGRSNDWNQYQKESYRILNSNFHNLTIMTYDHVLERAKTILGINKKEETCEEIDIKDIPF